MLRLKTSAASSTNGELEKAGDSRASRGEGKVLRVRIYTPPAFKVLKVIAFPGKRGGGGGQLPPLPPPPPPPGYATDGGYLACRRVEESREGCLHQGSRKSGVLAEAELGRGRKDR